MLIGALARTPGTLLHRELLGDTPTADWSLDQLLLAAVHDQLALANWQRQGKKGARRPDPIFPQAKRPELGRVGNVDGLDQREVIAVLNANAGR